MYVDEHELTVRGGKGGDGKSSFRREKYVAKGGPDGGDGGRGGNVVLVASHHLNGLGHLRFVREIKAAPGGNGGGSNCAGANAEDTVVEVPVGTLVFDLGSGSMLSKSGARGAEDDDKTNPLSSPEPDLAAAFTAEGASGEDEPQPEPAAAPRAEARLLVDLATPGQRYIVAYGGRGGFGNKHFATATHQRPREANPGAPGQVRRVKFEVKLIADAGLVGLPNAGKSTLLARTTKARPKIAPYPFTTLSPYLGVVQLGDREQFVLADIPGLIEGASQGKGLGHRFLRHVERTGVLVHLIDVSEGDAESLKRDHDTIVGELASFSDALAAKPRIVVANKADIPGAAERAAELEKLLGVKVHLISGVTGLGITELLWRIFRRLQELRAPAP